MKNNKIFRIVFIVFLLIVILLLVDMARQTTPPWKKKKATPNAQLSPAGTRPSFYTPEETPATACHPQAKTSSRPKS